MPDMIRSGDTEALTVRGMGAESWQVRMLPSLVHRLLRTSGGVTSRPGLSWMMTSMGEVSRQDGTEEHLRQEVRELTDLLRSDSDFGDLRDLLTDRGLAASETLLVGLIASEDDSSYGVFVTADLECVVFETASNGQLIRWENTDDFDALAKDFGAVAVGIAMRRTGEIR